MIKIQQQTIKLAHSTQDNRIPKISQYPTVVFTSNILDPLAVILVSVNKCDK